MDHGSLLEPKTILQSMLRDVYSSNSYIYDLPATLVMICRLAVFELGDCSGVTRHTAPPGPGRLGLTMANDADAAFHLFSVVSLKLSCLSRSTNWLLVLYLKLHVNVIH